MSTHVRLLRAAAPIVALVLAMPALAGLSAQTSSGRALAIEDYYRVKTVGGPELSPDGKWVAYTVSTRVEATNDNTSEVWLAAFDGSLQPKRVSADAARNLARRPVPRDRGSGGKGDNLLERSPGQRDTRTKPRNAEGNLRIEQEL